MNATAGESKEMNKLLARTKDSDHLDAQPVHRIEVTQVPVTGDNISVSRTGSLFPGKTMMNASRGPNMRSKFAKENKYRKERKKQKLDSAGEDYKVNSAASTSHPSSSRHRSTEINTSTKSKFGNDINSLKNYKKLPGLENVPVGTTESLSNYRDIPNSTGLLTFLSFTSGISFLVYLSYLYRCKKSHSCHHHMIDRCVNKKRIEIAHLQINRSEIEKMYPDVSDTLW